MSTVRAYRAIPGPFAVTFGIASTLLSIAAIVVLAVLFGIIVALVVVLTPVYLLGRREERRRAQEVEQAMMVPTELTQEES